MSAYKNQTEVGQIFGSWRVISDEFFIKSGAGNVKVIIVEELANARNQKIITVDYELANLKWSSRREQANNKRNNNATPGVSFHNRNKAWCVQVQLSNKTRLTKSYSVNKYGNQEAHNLALAYREEIRKEYGV